MSTDHFAPATPSLRDRLRTATAAAHAAIEEMPFSIALREGTLPGVAAASYLHCLAIVHAVLERGLATATDLRIRELWTDDLAKLPLLLEDMRLFAPRFPESIAAGVNAALEAGDGIVRLSGSGVALLGYLYVLEGSQNGAIAQKDLFAAALGVRPDELSYIGCYGRDTHRQWMGFVGRLDALRLSEAEINAAEAAASAAFAGLVAIVGALFPTEGKALVRHVTAINPEAGRHPIPTDPAEITVALHAGARTRERYPYLDLRFGERGRRFTASDSCWLLTLVREEYASIARSIAWLRSVLASRGIPTIILETHMADLADELERSDPSRATADFRRVIADLTAMRQRHLPEATARRLAGRFETRLPVVDGQDVGALSLLTSAWSDELAGIPGACDAVASWLAGAAPSDDGRTAIAELRAELRLLNTGSAA